MKNINTNDLMIDSQSVKSLRHQLHIACNWDNWMELYPSTKKEITNIIKEYNLPEIVLPQVSYEEAYCNRDDCGIESCSHCEELEQELFHEYKEKINELIEDWMRQVEKATGIEDFAPSGIARYNWTMQGANPFN